MTELLTKLEEAAKAANEAKNSSSFGDTKKELARQMAFYEFQKLADPATVLKLCLVLRRAKEIPEWVGSHGTKCKPDGWNELQEALAALEEA